MSGIVGPREDDGFGAYATLGCLAGLENVKSFSGIPAAWVASFFPPPYEEFRVADRGGEPYYGEPNPSLASSTLLVGPEDIHPGVTPPVPPLAEPPVRFWDRLDVRVIGDVLVLSLSLLAIPESLLRTSFAVGQYAIALLLNRGVETSSDALIEGLRAAVEPFKEAKAFVDETIEIADPDLARTIANVENQSMHEIEQSKHFVWTAVPAAYGAQFFPLLSQELKEEGRTISAGVCHLLGVVCCLSTSLMSIPEVVLRSALIALSIIEPEYDAMEELAEKKELSCSHILQPTAFTWMYLQRAYALLTTGELPRQEALEVDGRA